MRRIVLIAILVLLSGPNLLAQEPCTADFDCNGNVDALDVSTFLNQFGRSPFNNPCPDCYDSPCACSTCITCSGTLSPLGRWCDQEDGTVKDMTTGLLWLKNAGWGGSRLWADCTTWDDAQTRAGTLHSGMADLTDGSVEGDWRLPTLRELLRIIVGDEYIRYNQMYFFTGVQGDISDPYWSSTTHTSNNSTAWCVNMYNGSYGTCDKTYPFYVWPVRGGQ